MRRKRRVDLRLTVKARGVKRRRAMSYERGREWVSKDY